MEGPVPLTAEGLLLTPELALRWLTVGLLLLAEGEAVAFRSSDGPSLSENRYRREER